MNEYVTSYFLTKAEADNRLASLFRLGIKGVRNGREGGQWYVSYPNQ